MGDSGSDDDCVSGHFMTVRLLGYLGFWHLQPNKKVNGNDTKMGFNRLNPFFTSVFLMAFFGLGRPWRMDKEVEEIQGSLPFYGTFVFPSGALITFHSHSGFPFPQEHRGLKMVKD